MALINCPECGKEISDKSVRCVNCGYPLSRTDFVQDVPENSKSMKRLIAKTNPKTRFKPYLIVNIVFLVFSFAMIGSCGNSQENYYPSLLFTVLLLSSLINLIVYLINRFYIVSIVQYSFAIIFSLFKIAQYGQSVLFILFECVGLALAIIAFTKHQKIK